MIWIISYKLIGSRENLFSKLEAESYGEASDKAKRVIKLINNRMKEYNQQFEIVNITPLKCIESWDE